MKIILVSNNEMATNYYFEDETNIETKKTFRPLSIEGTKEIEKILKKPLFANAERIYSDASIASIVSGEFLSEYLNTNLIINKKLHDCKIGELGNKSVKMLSYFQEHDFDFKLYGGESLNECCLRISSFIRKVLGEGYENICVFLPKRCIMAYLLKYTGHEYNLDDKLILSFKDEIIMGENDESTNIFILTYENNELKNIELG